MKKSKNFHKPNKPYIILRRWLPQKIAYRLVVYSIHKTQSGKRGQDMTLAQRKHQKNQKLIKAYIVEHPTLKQFASILKRAADAEKDVKITISIGQAKGEDVFLSYLSSCIKNPRILFTVTDNLPMVLISDKSYTLASICLADMRDLKICADCTGKAFDSYNIRFSLKKPTGRLDYDMHIVIGK